MSIRLSEIGEYSQRVAVRRPAAEYPTSRVPDALPRESLTTGHGLRLTETTTRRDVLGGRLGELVQVVT